MLNIAGHAEAINIVLSLSRSLSHSNTHTHTLLYLIVQGFCPSTFSPPLSLLDTLSCKDFGGRNTALTISNMDGLQSYPYKRQTGTNFKALKSGFLGTANQLYLSSEPQVTGVLSHTERSDDTSCGVTAVETLTENSRLHPTVEN